MNLPLLNGMGDLLSGMEGAHSFNTTTNSTSNNTSTICLSTMNDMTDSDLINNCLFNSTPSTTTTTTTNNSSNNSVQVEDDLIFEIFTFNMEDPEGLVSDAALNIFVILNNVILSGIISLVGSVFNVINIIVFYRLGFADTVNITLLSLAVADLGALLTLVWKAVCFNPLFSHWDQIPFDYQGIQYFTAGWPHVCFARISSLITAFVTFERCLCIAMPLKVRRIITPTRTAIINVAIFLIIMGSIAPVYFVISLGPRFFQDRNRTLIGLIYSENGAFVEYISLSFNIFVQIFSVVAVIICTVILVVELRQKTAWRMKTANAGGGGGNVVVVGGGGSGGNGGGGKDGKGGGKSGGGGKGGKPDATSMSSSVRDVKVVKMVLFISTIFIICFFPSAVNLITMVSVTEYSIRGRYSNLFVLTWAVFNTLESTNSTVNIFIYIKMSSKYANKFYTMFGRNDNNDKSKPKIGREASSIVTTMTTSK